MARDQAALGGIARQVREFAGIDPPPWLVEARARERAHGGDLEGYRRRLEGDGAELGALVEVLRVGETRFFRHKTQIQALRRTAIPARRAARSACRGEPGGERLRAWSAGCASGEEAWTLAILLAEEAAGAAAGERPSEEPLNPGERRLGFEVYATDLSEVAIATARAGRYAPTNLEGVPPALRLRWFVDGGSVAPALRPYVRFEKKNLLDPAYPGGFDLILCRNVLIYFDAAGRDQVIARLAGSLLPGGYLFLGYSETLRSHDELFEVQRADGGGLIYRRRGPLAEGNPAIGAPGGERSRVAQPPPAVIAPPPPQARERRSTLRSAPPPAALVVRLSGTYDDEDSARLTLELRPVLDGRARRVDLDGAEFLGEEAARILIRAAESVGSRITLRAGRVSVRRWIERHRLGERFTIEAGSE